MGRGFTARASATIDAGQARVWQALTDPAMIRQYLFGTEAESDWKEGSPITYRGVWEGKAYEDRGKVLKVIPGRLLESSYWSAFSGLPDSPENYARVSYELAEREGKTTITVTQDNNPSEESARHSEANWNAVLAALKELLEKAGA